MQQWWEARRVWERVAIAICGFVVVRTLVIGPITRFFGGASGETASGSFLVPLLILTGALVLVLFGIVAMMSRAVGTTLGDTRFAPTSEFRMPHRVGGDDLLPAAFAPKASGPADMVDALEALGFRRAGSYDVELADHTAVFACMICPEGSTLAVVTPLHLTMQSDLDGKVLVTADRNTGAKSAPWALHQIARRRTPATVWKDHRRALDVLLQRGLTPTVLNAQSAATVAVGIDHASVVHFNASNQTRAMLTGLLPGANQPVDGSPRSQSEIERWLGRPERWVDTL